MRIASWNVNSLRARHDLVIDWVRRNTPDILCLQETKVTDDDFPREEFLRLGYDVAIAGQKAYNGVAIASRTELRAVTAGLDSGFTEDSKRLLSARVGDTHVFCAYVPNGKSLESPSFQEKLQWLKELRSTLDARATPTGDVILCGDFNVALDDRDTSDPVAMRGQVHFTDEEKAAVANVLSFGLKDTLRLHHQSAGLYSWWDYRAGAVRRNAGLRIDYIFASDSLCARCESVSMDKAERLKDKPSDHIPVVAQFRAK